MNNEELTMNVICGTQFSACIKKSMTEPKQKKIPANASDETTESLSFKHSYNKSDEIESDGSGEAFEQTEEVNEDNFDDLKEK